MKRKNWLFIFVQYQIHKANENELVIISKYELGLTSVKFHT